LTFKHVFQVLNRISETLIDE